MSNTPAGLAALSWDATAQGLREFSQHFLGQAHKARLAQLLAKESRWPKVRLMLSKGLEPDDRCVVAREESLPNADAVLQQLERRGVGAPAWLVWEGDPPGYEGELRDLLGLAYANRWGYTSIISAPGVPAAYIDDYESRRRTIVGRSYRAETPVAHH